MTDDATVSLFSYGTLRQDNVQIASLGRLLVGRPDALRGYTTIMTEITDPNVVATSGLKFHPMVVHTDHPADEVPGMRFSVTEAELAAADKYEVSDHKRINKLDPWMIRPLGEKEAQHSGEGALTVMYAASSSEWFIGRDQMRLTVATARL
jgi:hypothetical protein